MSMEQRTNFQIDKSKCVKCGKCINTCSGMVIVFGPDGYPCMSSEPYEVPSAYSLPNRMTEYYAFLQAGNVHSC